MKKNPIIPSNETSSRAKDLLVLTDSLKKISINHDIRTAETLAGPLIKDYISEIFYGYEKIQLQKQKPRKKFPADIQKSIVTLLTDALITIKKLSSQHNFDDVFANIAEQYCTKYNIKEQAPQFSQNTENKQKPELPSCEVTQEKDQTALVITNIINKVAKYHNLSSGKPQSETGMVISRDDSPKNIVNTLSQEINYLFFAYLLNKENASFSQVSKNFRDLIRYFFKERLYSSKTLSLHSIKNLKCMEALIIKSISLNNPIILQSCVSFFSGINLNFFARHLVSESGVSFNGTVKITPLQKAAHATTSHCLKVLLENKADINLQNSSGDTALHYAVCSHSQSIEILRILLEYKADVNFANLEGRTPLIEADRNNLSEHVKILREKPGNVKIFKSPHSLRRMAAIVKQSKSCFDDIVNHLSEELKGHQLEIQQLMEKRHIEYIKKIESEDEARDNKHQSVIEKEHRKLLYSHQTVKQSDLENKHSSNIKHFGLIPLQHDQSREGCMNRVMQVLGEIQRMTIG
jgi:ankyrin repeat protein